MLLSIPKKEYSNGYITLLSILVVGAVGAAIALSIILLGLASSRTSFAEHESGRARALADACIEEGLQQIWNSDSFTGSNTIVLSTGSCTYTVANQGGQNRTVHATSTAGSAVRHVQVIIDELLPRIHIISWQEF